MAEGDEPTPRVISLIVKNPSNHALDFSMEVPADSTILAVKQRLQRDYVGNPDPTCQKLIVSGQIVRDEQVFKDVFSKANLSETQVVHLVIPGMQAHPPSHAQPPGPTQTATTARQLPPLSQPRVAAPESRIINPPLPTAPGATPASSPSPAPVTSAPQAAPEPAGIAAATRSNVRPITPVVAEASTPAGPLPRPPPAATPQMPPHSHQPGSSSQGAGTSTRPEGEGAAPSEQEPRSGHPQAMSPEALHNMYMQMLVGNPMMAALPFNPALMHPALMGFPPMVPPIYPGFHPGLGILPQYTPQPGNHPQQQLPHPGAFALPPNMPVLYGGFPYALPLGAPLPYLYGQPGQGGVYAHNLGGAQGVTQGAATAAGLRQRPGQQRPGMPQPAAAAAVGAVPPGAAAAAVGAARVPGVARRRRVQIDLFLLLKLAVVVFVFNQDGSMERLFLLSIAATIVYLYQTGTLAPFLRRLARNTQRALHPPQPGQAPAPVPPAGAGVAQAGPAGVGDPLRAPVGGPPGQGIQRGEQWQLVREVQMFLLGFLTSLFPGWQAPEEVIPRAPPEPAPADPGQAAEPDRPHQD